MLSALAVYGVVVLLVVVFTPHLTFNDGFGDLDGRAYAAMVAQLRGGLPVDLPPEYVYRILPVELVAHSRIDPLTGFLVLNLTGLTVAAILLYALLRAYGISSTVAIIGVAWWAVLPAGIRLSWYYPYLVDGVGYGFLTALLYLAVKGRFALFAIVLPFALLTRENLVTLIPFLWLVNARRIGLLRSGALTSAVALPGMVAFELVRLFPVIAPAKPADTLGDIRQNFEWFRTNTAERSWRFEAAPFLTLGIIPAVVIARARAVARFLRSELAWVYYVLSTLVLAIIGGGDYDRFDLWLAPAVLVMALRSAPLFRWWPAIWILLTSLHLLAARFLVPLAPGAEGYRTYVVALMPMDQVVAALARCLLTGILAWMLLTLTPQAPRASTAP